MDNLLFIILLLVPGSITEMIIKSKWPPSRRARRQYEEITVLLSSGLLSVSAAFGLTCLLSGKFFSSIGEFVKALDSVVLMFAFVASSVTAAIIIGLVLSSNWMVNFQLSIKNRIRESQGKQPESKYKTVWDEIIEDPEAIPYGTVVQIIKDGTVLTQGELKSRPSHDSGTSELKLVNTSVLEKYFTHDSNCDTDEEKFFANVLFDYYDMDRSVLIKFYDGSKYLAYVASVTSSAAAEGLEPS